jgi:hypothetical protein
MRSTCPVSRRARLVRLEVDADCVAPGRRGPALGGRLVALHVELPGLDVAGHLGQAGQDGCRCYTRSVSDEVLRQRILATFDMFEAGVDLMRQRLKRQYPAETARQIELRLAAWLHERPGAEHGDAVGRVGTWPRRQPP